MVEKMQTLRFQVKEKKAQLFREKAMQKYGHGKGSISKALDDAINTWLDKYGAKESAIRPSDLTGSLSSKDSALEAQKKAVKLWGNG